MKSRASAPTNTFPEGAAPLRLRIVGLVKEQPTKERGRRKGQPSSVSLEMKRVGYLRDWKPLVRVETREADAVNLGGKAVLETSTIPQDGMLETFFFTVNLSVFSFSIQVSCIC